MKRNIQKPPYVNFYRNINDETSGNSKDSYKVAIFKAALIGEFEGIVKVADLQDVLKEN